MSKANSRVTAVMVPASGVLETWEFLSLSSPTSSPFVFFYKDKLRLQKIKWRGGNRRVYNSGVYNSIPMQAVDPLLSMVPSPSEKFQRMEGPMLSSFGSCSVPSCRKPFPLTATPVAAVPLSSPRLSCCLEAWAALLTSPGPWLAASWDLVLHINTHFALCRFSRSQEVWQESPVL